MLLCDHLKEGRVSYKVINNMLISWLGFIKLVYRVTYLISFKWIIHLLMNFWITNLFQMLSTIK